MAFKTHSSKEILKGFRRVRALVVGDVMLDTYVHGSVERLSVEAPVPILKFEHAVVNLGGAANVAYGMAALGGLVSLVGVCGADSTGKHIRTLARKSAIHPLFVYDKTRPTTHKQRLVTKRYHQIVRLDYEDSKALSGASERALITSVRKALRSVDVLVISDYGKGVCAAHLRTAYIALARKAGIPIVLDPKPTDSLYSKSARGVTLLTPNRHEAEILGLGGKLHPVRLATALSKQFTANVLITLGEDGMILAQKNKKPLQLSALAKSVVDITGAGDTVAAVCGLVLGAGGSLAQAADIANKAASIVVSKAGTAAVFSDELGALL